MPRNHERELPICGELHEWKRRAEESRSDREKESIKRQARDLLDPETSSAGENDAIRKEMMQALLCLKEATNLLTAKKYLSNA